jgi:hypothetical protein
VPVVAWGRARRPRLSTLAWWLHGACRPMRMCLLGLLHTGTGMDPMACRAPGEGGTPRLRRMRKLMDRSKDDIIKVI